MPYPLNRDFINTVHTEYEKILIIEETYPVIELQLTDARVQGRTSGLVPREGELTPDVIRPVLETFLSIAGPGASRPRRAAATDPPSAPAAPTGRRSTPLRRPSRRGIFPSDIGCYTLGLNLGAVDTCHCMGAGISQAAGFYRAYAAGGGEFPTIVATIGDSTFFHAGVPALVNAVFHQARFILVILDNATTAMTGHQPTPQVGFTATGEAGHPVFIPDLVRASGAGFIREADPYDLPAFMDLLRSADAYCRSPAGGVAVVIAKHPCLLDKDARKSQTAYIMRVTEDCTGCRHCLDDFECPALSLDEADGRVVIDGGRCVGCGVCVHVCPEGAIIGRQRGAAMKQQIIVSGLGGQGALTLTRLLAEAAAAMGLSGHHLRNPRHGPAGRHGHLHDQGGALPGSPDPRRGGGPRAVPPPQEPGGAPLLPAGRRGRVRQYRYSPAITWAWTPGPWRQPTVCLPWRPTSSSWGSPRARADCSPERTFWRK